MYSPLALFVPRLYCEKTPWRLRQLSASVWTHVLRRMQRNREALHDHHSRRMWLGMVFPL